MNRQILSSVVAMAMALGIAASAQAYSGRTTDKTYKTGTAAAKATAAYYMTKAVQGKTVYHASDMKVVTRGKTPSTTVTSTWKLVTTQLTPFGYPVARVNVKIKKISDHKWKGYTDGKLGVSFLK